MIFATAYDKHAEVVVLADPGKGNFYKELNKFRSQIPAKDRSFNTVKKVWTVRNIQRYMHLDYIRFAFDDRKQQLELF